LKHAVRDFKRVEDIRVKSRSTVQSRFPPSHNALVKELPAAARQTIDRCYRATDKTTSSSSSWRNRNWS